MKEKEKSRRIIMTMEVINPATGETIKTYATLTEAEVKQEIQASHEAFLSWRNVDVESHHR